MVPDQNFTRYGNVWELPLHRTVKCADGIYSQWAAVPMKIPQLESDYRCLELHMKAT